MVEQQGFLFFVFFLMADADDLRADGPITDG